MFDWIETTGCWAIEKFAIRGEIEAEHGVAMDVLEIIEQLAGRDLPKL